MLLWKLPKPNLLISIQSGFAHPLHLQPEDTEERRRNIYRQLQVMFDNLVSVAARTNCWFVVQGGPNGGLILLEEAMSRVSVRVVILVIDQPSRGRYTDLEDYKEMKEFSKESVNKELATGLKEGMSMSEKLCEKAVSLDQ